MGFNPFTAVKFTFEGSRFAGAEITMNLDIPLGDVIGYPTEPKTKLADQWQWFQAHALISWNLEDRKGEPIPIEAPVEKLPRALISLVMQKWFEAVVDTSTPLEALSRGGVT